MTRNLRYFFMLTLFILVPQLAAQRKEDIGRTEPIDAPQRNETSDARRATDFSRGGRSGTFRYFRNFSKTREVKKGLKVNQEDSLKYQSFLKNPDTGIFKLLPQPNCREVVEQKLLKKCIENNMSIRVFANAYSFREREHTFDTMGDFNLFAGSLDAGISEVHTIIVNLGNRSLEDLTLESGGIEYLRNYMPQTELAKVKRQFEAIRRGVRVGHYEYSKSSPVKLDDVYVVRSIAYANEAISAKNALDLMIALKVVRLDADGSVTIIWKELARKSAPKLEIVK